MPPAPGELVRHYDWDRAGRLARIRDAGASGVRGETRFHHDLRDQTVAVERPGAREAYRYDARGRMVERILAEQGFRPRRWRYRWDGFDQLVELETPDGVRWRYSYDAFGRRVGKTLLGGTATRRVDYVWQGISLAEAWYRSGHRTGEGKGDESLSIERWHFEPDGLRPLAKELVPAGPDAEPVLAEAQWLPIVADQLGAPHALFGEDGQCHWRAEPELWGRTRTARALLRERGGSDAGGEGDTAPCALRFPGQWEDAESGLHYNLNRYYDPETGQYLSPDPIGVDGGLRTHAYVHDPLRWFDPDGLAACVKFKRWKPGDAIDKPMPDGSPPKWDVVRSRYWKNRADAAVRENTGEFDAATLARMRRGAAPLDANGNPMELHHHVPQRAPSPNTHNPGNLREVTREQHSDLDPFRHL
nr:RHS repeat-associated core domain-containing protein [Sphingomonas pseudosanguinis]